MSDDISLLPFDNYSKKRALLFDADKKTTAPKVPIIDVEPPPKLLGGAGNINLNPFQDDLMQREEVIHNWPRRRERYQYFAGIVVSGAAMALSNGYVTYRVKRYGFPQVKQFTGMALFSNIWLSIPFYGLLAQRYVWHPLLVDEMPDIPPTTTSVSGSRNTNFVNRAQLSHSCPVCTDISQLALSLGFGFLLPLLSTPPLISFYATKLNVYQLPAIRHPRDVLLIGRLWSRAVLQSSVLKFSIVGAVITLNLLATELGLYLMRRSRDLIYFEIEDDPKVVQRLLEEKYQSGRGVFVGQFEEVPVIKRFYIAIKQKLFGHS